ncbi:MAG: hypothetical protein AABW89_05855 [Nanoarchaeota archaeon]
MKDIIKIRILEKKPNYEVLGIGFSNYPEWKGKKVSIKEITEDGVKKLIITEFKPMTNEELIKQSKNTIFVRFK